MSFGVQALLTLYTDTDTVVKDRRDGVKGKRGMNESFCVIRYIILRKLTKVAFS